MKDNLLVEKRIQGERARVRENINAQTETPEDIFYLSFADDDGFRGAVFVHANEFLEALTRAGDLKINPGGEVVGLPVPRERREFVTEEMKNKLLSKQELEQFNEQMEAAIAKKEAIQ